jgi:molybdate-binding protein/DNA-binding transcriptional regulator YhcF (GntR family)
MKQSETFLYQEIAESLRRLIASGEFEPGDKLPTVRKMAQRWNCTPGTVSRAYSELAQEGLVEGFRGGGTRVTASALQPTQPILGWATLVNRAETFLLQALSSGHTPEEAESALFAAIARWRELQETDVPPRSEESGSDGVAFRFAGSHDLCIEILARLLNEQDASIQFSIEYLGSLGGLIALARGKAEVAGSHLWDESVDSYNAPFIRRVFPGHRVPLITLAHRSLGIIVPAGNPQGMATLADLTLPNVEIVNRQSGSGTRVWLDAQLKRLDIPPQTLSGYQREELTHVAVAFAIANGEATAGVGIFSAAAAYGLDFVPLTTERYDLVFTEASWQTSAAAKFRAIIGSDRFKRMVEALGGYETHETGKEVWIG